MTSLKLSFPPSSVSIYLIFSWEYTTKKQYLHTPPLQFMSSLKTQLVSCLTCLTPSSMDGGTDPFMGPPPSPGVREDSSSPPPLIIHIPELVTIKYEDFLEAIDTKSQVEESIGLDEAMELIEDNPSTSTKQSSPTSSTSTAPLRIIMQARMPVTGDDSTDPNRCVPDKCTRPDHLGNPFYWGHHQVIPVDILDTHLKMMAVFTHKHTADDSLICTICKSVSNSFPQAMMHARTHGMLLGKDSNKKTLARTNQDVIRGLQKLRQDNAKRFHICLTQGCFKIFKTTWALVWHSRLAHYGLGNLRLCPLCDTYLPGSTDFDSHFSAKHAICCGLREESLESFYHHMSRWHPCKFQDQLGPHFMETLALIQHSPVGFTPRQWRIPLQLGKPNTLLPLFNFESWNQTMLHLQDKHVVPDLLLKSINSTLLQRAWHQPPHSSTSTTGAYELISEIMQIHLINNLSSRMENQFISLLEPAD